ncbi:MAG TPA: 50S ribosomal protein L25 [Candidatus Acidoferrales bacterium]|nr:50S ribosomal protein L25 [Candidatus Acidoferrales bacterium]
METVELGATVRENSGKSAAKRLRRDGKVPAVFYGPKRASTLLAVDAHEFALKVSGLEGAHLIKFASDSDLVRDCVALVKDTQLHPVTGEVLHTDFYEVDMTRTLRVRAPLHFEGKAAGVALGGILQPIAREIEVECLPADIPDFISVDVSSLGIHDAIHVGQLQMPKGVKAIFEQDFAVVSVLAPSVEEVKAEAAPEAAAEQPGAAAEAAKPEAEKKGAAS